jgi:hypothetical protein
MQFIAPLFAGIGAGGTAAATAGAATAGGIGSSVLSGLQLASGVLGAVGSIGAGYAAKREAEAQAAEAEFASREEFIQSKETSSVLKAELARTVANQTVSFAASGVDLKSVSVEQAKKQAVDDAERELGLSGNEAIGRSLARRRQARSLRERGSNAVFQGFVGATQRLANTGMDLAARGT